MTTQCPSTKVPSFLNVPKSTIDNVSIPRWCPRPDCILWFKNPPACPDCPNLPKEGELMPRRFGLQTRIWVYRFLVLRDGESCSRCGKISATRNEVSVSFPATRNEVLEVDHIDGNKLNNDPRNLRLLCKRCNIAVRNRYSARNVCVCAKELASDTKRKVNQAQNEGNPATRIARDVVNYNSGDAAMQANFLYEVSFRDWLLSQIRIKGFILRQEAIVAGAEVVGCSPSTTQRYITKLTSFAGVLQETRDMLGAIALTWKPEYQPLEDEKQTVSPKRNGE